MALGGIGRHVRNSGRAVGSFIARMWRAFRALTLWFQIVIGVIVIALLITLITVASGGKSPAEGETLRTVTLAPLSALSGGGTGSDVLGTVRSVTEADLLAQSAGTVTGVNITVGQSVAAGTVIAELENSSQRASVLQAQGAYDAALAAQAAVSPTDAVSAARNAYRSAFTTIDTALENDVDQFFGEQTPYGPRLLISASADATKLPRKRAQIQDMMNAWRGAIPGADARNGDDLLAEAKAHTAQVQSFIEELATEANRIGSDATSAQLTALATARANVNGAATALTTAEAAYRSGSTQSTASVDAGVKSALGTLRLAESNLEKTLIRAPIGGTVNFMPLHVGDYVTNLEHVATVAQNGALEIILYVSEDTRQVLEVGGKVTVENTTGVVTSIAPALDPVTKLVEVHVAVAAGNSLVNGQSVHVTLPGAPIVTAATSTPTTLGSYLLPLTAVKLTADARVLFTVVDGRLVAEPVTIGDVHGDRIAVTTSLPADAAIVTDARGLSDGQAVIVATTTP
jgi:multidrug efflux pump subunit AcrA (membrane-fusion protein)